MNAAEAAFASHVHSHPEVAKVCPFCAETLALLHAEALTENALRTTKHDDRCLCAACHARRVS